MRILDSPNLTQQQIWTLAAATPTWKHEDNRQVLYFDITHIYSISDDDCSDMSPDHLRIHLRMVERAAMNIIDKYLAG